jgi:hypothetical protein
MGTNYYWHEKDECACCGRPYEPKHIGKSSSGWVFALRVYPEDGINDVDDWETRWKTPGSKIVDEYGQKLDAADMMITIMARARPERWDEQPSMYSDWETFHRINHSEKGPAGLLRHQIDGRHCIRHGAGTWDCMAGEFS